MSGVKVLLVDDEVDFVSTLAERLGYRGFEASFVTDGQQALDAIKESPPEVVVLDLLMPGIGGDEVLRAIRKDAPNIQVILLTGRGSALEKDIQKDFSGVAAVMMKPVKIEALIEKINQAAEVGRDERP